MCPVLQAANRKKRLLKDGANNAIERISSKQNASQQAVVNQLNRISKLCLVWCCVVSCHVGYISVRVACMHCMSALRCHAMPYRKCATPFISVSDIIMIYQIQCCQHNALFSVQLKRLDRGFFRWKQSLPRLKPYT